MRIEFTKMHGLGNDFIVFDRAPGAMLPRADDWRRLSDRRTGIGFDQAIVLEPPRSAGTDVYYRIFNADGEEVEQCGNGARCVAFLLQRLGRARGSRISMESAGGLVAARVDPVAADATLARVAVDMGPPRFAPQALPFLAPVEAPTYRLEVGDAAIEIGAVSMGNPHAVLIVPSVADAPVAVLGPALEADPRFPQRVNVGFMEIIARNEIRLRVYERGAGETLACGTGACGAVAVGQRLGRLDAEVLVHARGGDLEVRAAGPGDSIWLTGPAAVSFTGEIEI
jgi:diaminopimelate epimerase